MDINNLTYFDRSEFLRGFAVVIRKNNRWNLNQSMKQADEKSMFSIIGKYFGFEIEFCKQSFEQLMENTYISEEPAIFSNDEIAYFFIKDVFNILHQINSMSPDAIEWLKQTAKVNKVSFNLIAEN